MKMNKGIILAGGAGTRLWPLTVPVCKQLLPVFDKPMVYYPLTTLMFAGISDILIITTPNDMQRFQELLGEGSQWGVKISYRVQEKPEGIAQAFLIAEDFILNEPCALVLGDNIFYGAGFADLVYKAAQNPERGATIFGYYVQDPERFGVVKCDSLGRPLELQEKPKSLISNWAVTGLYFYDNEVVSIAKSLKPSSRGELEITDLNKVYLQSKRLHLERMGRGYAWLDAGTHESLLEASNFIHSIEKRQGLKIGCPEEVAYRMKFMNRKMLEKFAQSCPSRDLKIYLTQLLAAEI